MDFETAYGILGIEEGDDEETIKKKYRKLMLDAHPDMGNDVQRSSADVREINEAYDLLLKKGEFRKWSIRFEEEQRRKQKSASIQWDAPINERAYTDRDIYQYAEDPDGISIGTYILTTGRYIWNPEEEEQELFLHSIFTAAGRLLDETEQIRGYELSRNDRLMAQKELIYLLAGQFTDLEHGLRSFAKEIKEDISGSPVYYVPAMLELNANAVQQLSESVKTWGTHNKRMKPAATERHRSSPADAVRQEVGSKHFRFRQGEPLHPICLRDHKLYLGTSSGQELGYLSFSDDRLYYILIPMFENREVQVRINVASDCFDASFLKMIRKQRFVELNLWVRKRTSPAAIQTDSNRRIESILNQL